MAAIAAVVLLSIPLTALARQFTRPGAWLFTTIDVPGATQTGCTGINARGQIVGWYIDHTDAGFAHHGFVLSQGTFTPIDFPGAETTSATGINANGEIVGYYFVAGEGRLHGFLLSRGHFTTVDVPGAKSSFVSGINRSGEMVGNYDDDAGARHGFALQNGQFTTIDVPGAIDVPDAVGVPEKLLISVNGINDAGDIVGSFTAGEIIRRGDHGDYLEFLRFGFQLSKGRFIFVQPPGALSNDARGINGHGDIVGAFGDANHVQHAYLLSNGVSTQLHRPGAAFPQNSGIDANGNVVGEYEDRSGNKHGFEARPNDRLSK